MRFVLVAVTLLAALLVLLAGDGPRSLGLPFDSVAGLLPNRTALLVSMAMGGCLAWTALLIWLRPADGSKVSETIVLPATFAASVALLLFAVSAGQVGAGRAAVALPLLISATIAALASVERLRKGEPVGIESHWGGIGGGGGGWRVLPGTALAILAVGLFAAAAALVAVGPAKAPATPTTPDETGRGRAATNADAPTDAAVGQLAKQDDAVDAADAAQSEVGNTINAAASRGPGNAS